MRIPELTKTDLKNGLAPGPFNLCPFRVSPWLPRGGTKSSQNGPGRGPAIWNVPFVPFGLAQRFPSWVPKPVCYGIYLPLSGTEQNGPFTGGMAMGPSGALDGWAAIFAQRGRSILPRGIIPV